MNKLYKIMKTNKINIKSVEPTGIVIDEKKIIIKGINEYPTRMILEINDNIWMISENGNEISKIR